MQQPIKRLGELLVEGGLITPAQLQSAVTHQKIARGRLGSNLVALGYITEEVLVDFLSRQTGVPQVDVRDLEVPLQVLRLVPQRLADQFTMLPVSIKEPKSLVLAMSDPSDLNAIDSARFASGLHIEPVVASHSALRKAIADLYRRVEPRPAAMTVELGGDEGPEEALPVSFSLDPLPAPSHTPAPAPRHPEFPPDPFFDTTSAPTQPLGLDPFGLFDPQPAPRAAVSAPAPGVVVGRTLGDAIPRLETYRTRTLVLGLIRALQRRGVLGEDELQRLLANLIDSGELKDEDRPG